MRIAIRPEEGGGATSDLARVESGWRRSPSRWLEKLLYPGRGEGAGRPPSAFAFLSPSLGPPPPPSARPP